MNPFRYARASDAVSALAAIEREPSAQYIAGGTNVLDLMKDDVERPALLVDINRLPLAQIERRPGVLFIGALARMSEVARHPEVRGAFPLVAAALEQSASPQLRNMASIGGNVLQRTRCPYFRDVATPCNKRAPGSGCGALHGTNRMEAVLGTSDDCIATHASDLAVTFAALDTVVHVAGARGERDVAFREFYRLPGTTPQLETTLARGELITGFSLPLLPHAARTTYLKVRDRAEYAFALASAAVALALDGTAVRDVRIALGGIATVPWRAREAERMLTGARATHDAFVRAADAALAGARGYGENDYKIALAKRTLVRALETTAAAA